MIDSPNYMLHADVERAEDTYIKNALQRYIYIDLKFH